jgi:hypothetical protein
VDIRICIKEKYILRSCCINYILFKPALRLCYDC